MASEYDFVVVGGMKLFSLFFFIFFLIPTDFSAGGASGCAVASRLAKSAQRPSVLLLEAGGDNEDAPYLVPADRFTLAFQEASLNWGYKTISQH